MTTIFHITTGEAWEKAERDGVYRTAMLPVEGFIHCSTREQVVQTANRLFRGQTGLVLLRIDANRVRPEIRYENLEGGAEMFPHIYGELNIDAVVQVAEFEPDGEGLFSL